MGVYISGIDMPKENEILQIRIYGDGKVSRVYDIKCKQIGTAIETTKALSIENEWTPVSEGLPEEETDVLVTRKFLGCKDGSHGWNNHIPPSTYVEVASYFDGEWTALSDDYKVARSRHTDPIAWMPSPKPYREENEE